MPKSENQKLKLLHLYRILAEKTDEEHPITVKEMILELAKYDIKAERKSIYDDLDALRNFGVDIICNTGRVYSYSIGQRIFELPELKLLVDAVQSSKFITHKKSNELIKKLESLASKHEAKQLQRQVYVANRVKTMNESIYYNVDRVHEAITKNRQICFKYYEWNLNKERQLKKNGEQYITNPISLTWDDENYYLIAYSDKYDGLVHYRVDKMHEIELMEDFRKVNEGSKSFDLALYAKKVFGMFGGDDEIVIVKFENHLVGVVIDRFGIDIIIEKDGRDHFIAHLKVAVSPLFLSWIISFGNGAKIITPDRVAEQIVQLCNSAVGQY